MTSTDIFAKERIAVLCVAFTVAIAGLLGFTPTAFAAEGVATELAAQSPSISAQATNTNTTTEQATTIGLNSSVTISFDRADISRGADVYYWFKYKHSTRASKYLITVDSLDGTLTHAVFYDENMNRTGSLQTLKSKTRVTVYDTVQKTAEKGKWVYLNLRCDKLIQRQGDRFKITVKEYPLLNKPTLKLAKKTKSALTVKWNKQVNATKYRLFYKKTKGGSWKHVDVTKNQYTIKGLKKATYYQVKVRAFNENGWDNVNNAQCKWSAFSNTAKYKTAK